MVVMVEFLTLLLCWILFWKPHGVREKDRVPIFEESWGWKLTWRTRHPSYASLDKVHGTKRPLWVQRSNLGLV